MRGPKQEWKLTRDALEALVKIAEAYGLCTETDEELQAYYTENLARCEIR